MKRNTPCIIIIITQQANKSALIYTVSGEIETKGELNNPLRFTVHIAKTELLK